MKAGRWRAVAACPRTWQQATKRRRGTSVEEQGSHTKRNEAYPPCKAKIHGTKARHKDGHGKVVLLSVLSRVEGAIAMPFDSGFSAMVKTMAQGQAQVST
jgi:hypothetical protein